MNSHTIGNDTYGIFERSDKGSLLMLHFLWGKKDFRIFLERKGASSGKGAHPPLFRSKSNGEYVLSRLQYLYQYEWYDYDRVDGHGRALEEVRWKHANGVRYVELPLHFFEVAAELAAREFALKRKGASAQAM